MEALQHADEVIVDKGFIHLNIDIQNSTSLHSCQRANIQVQSLVGCILFERDAREFFTGMER